MVDISELTKKNSERWAAAKLTRAAEFGPVAKRLVAAKGRYQQIEQQTGVPWFVIAVIHQRESSQNFSKSLAQGDPWDRVSTHVPKGRGPFSSFEEAAIDALKICPPYAARWRDWSPGGTMALLEQYNGLGYYRKGIPSPYIWSGTDQYRMGKYVADGVFDASTVDKQLGCAGLIMAMRKIDPTIKFTGEDVPAPPDVEPAPVTPPAKPLPEATGSAAVGGVAATLFGLPWWGIALAIVAAAVVGYLIFKRK